MALSGGRPGRSWLVWPVWTRRLAAASYLGALTWAMLAPASAFEDVGELFPHQDKIVHAALFLALGALARWSRPDPGVAGKGRLAALAALLGYTVAIEALQPALGGAGRQFDWLDLAANVLGAGCGWLLQGRAGDTMPPRVPGMNARGRRER